MHEVGIRGSLQHDLSLPVVERHRQQVVRQHFVRDFRHTREHGADIEDAGDRPQQLDRAFEVRGAIAFERRAVRCLGEPLPREGDRDVISDALRDTELLFGVGVRANRQQGENPDRRVVDAHRHTHA
jgi:hypothetical protein